MTTKTPIVVEKDFLNEVEASVYMGCSQSGFRKMARSFNIPSAKVPGGRIVYRRNDLFKLNEQYFTAPSIHLDF